MWGSTTGATSTLAFLHRWGLSAWEDLVAAEQVSMLLYFSGKLPQQEKTKINK
jgi:hypothetical protein